MSDQADAKDLALRAFRAGRRRAIAAILPLIGLALYGSPILRIFGLETAVAGVPLVFLFVYGAWAVLIYLAWRVARRLVARDDL